MLEIDQDYFRYHEEIKTISDITKRWRRFQMLERDITKRSRLYHILERDQDDFTLTLVSFEGIPFKTESNETNTSVPSLIIH